MQRVLQLLGSLHPLSPELTTFLEGALKQKKVAKRGYLLRAGHTCHFIYFIERGLLRCYYMKGETEVCSWFMKEEDIVISVESFFNQKPSYEAIQAVEDTEVCYISYRELEVAYRRFPEFNYAGRLLLQKYYMLSEQRLRSMRMQTATERYQFLLRLFPEIIQRVSTSDIASYLGISRETLSRIKKDA